MAGLTPQAETAISSIPSCAASAIEQGILNSHCGLDIACICRDNSFIDILQQNISKTCDFQDEDRTLALAKVLCVEAIPSLADSKQSELVIVVAIMVFLASLAVLLRFYCKSITRAKLGADDYMITVALLLTYGLNIDSFLSIKAGTGLHLITLNLDQIEFFIKTEEASQILFPCAITVIKLSVLLFYRRFFLSSTFRTISLLVGCVNILWWIGSFLTAFLHCRPFAFYWDRSIPGGICANDNTVGYSITATELITDIIVLVLPIPWLSKMKLERRQKLAVIGLFMLGSFVCIAGIIRIPLLGRLKISDATWTAIDAGVWINVECNIGIVSACLPLLRPLFVTRYQSSPASYVARFVRSFSSHRVSRSSQGDDFKEKGASSSADSGKIVAKPWNAYRAPANNDASESTIHIAPKPIAKDEGYMTWGMSAALSPTEPERSTFEERDVEESIWRSTFGTGEEDYSVRDLEGNRSWISNPTAFMDNRRSDTYNLMPSISKWNRDVLLY